MALERELVARTQPRSACVLIKDNDVWSDG